jgi:uncharacterized protein (UPF0332 family)
VAPLAKTRDSLRGAEILTREFLYDIAVSRAYYAMFYCAEALLDVEGLNFSSHAAVLSAFGQHLAKTGRVPPEYHRYLIQAQDSRLLGDYDALSPRSEREALKHIGRAREFIALTEGLLGPEEPPVAHDRPATKQPRPSRRPRRRPRA